MILNVIALVVFLTLLIALVWLFIQYQKQKALIAKLTIFDPVTELKNSSAVLDDLDVMFQSAKRYHLPLTIILLKLPRLQTPDDEQAGLDDNKALKFLAQSLNQLLRTTDIMGRFSYNSLLIGLTNTNTHDARAVIERLIAQTNHPKIFQKLGPSIFGVTHVSSESRSLKHTLQLCAEAIKPFEDSTQSHVEYAHDALIAKAMQEKSDKTETN